MSRRTSLGLTVALLLIYMAARLTALTAFPSFGDEATHVDYGRTVLAQGPLARAEEGRQFVVWLYILFGAQANAALWIARAATLLTLLPGVAALIGTARLLSNRWGGLFAGLLLVFSPYHHFFERMALADPISASAVALAVYFAARLCKRVALIDAALCGIALFIACGAKISALPYFAVPPIAVLTLRRTRAGLVWGAAALAVGLALTGAYVGVLVWRGYNPFFHLQPTGSLPLSSVIPANIASSFATLSGYFTLPLALLLLVVMGVLVVRRRFFIPLLLVVPLAVLWMSSTQRSRHLIAPMSLLLLGAAVVLGDLVGRYRQLRAPAFVLVIAGGVLLWLPFALTEINAPFALGVPAADRAEYITSETSGFGLADVVAALKDRQPTRVIGVLANCVSLRDLAPFPVECPRLNPNGEDVQALTELLGSSRAAGVYTVLEDIAYAPTTAPGTIVATIDANRPRLTVYDLAP